MTGMEKTHSAGRLPKLLISLASVSATVALLPGPGVIRAGAIGTPDPTVMVNGLQVDQTTNTSPASNVPSSCATILSATQTAGTTKTFVSSVTNGLTTTYFFKVTSPKADNTQTNLEDCAYANGDPSNIKYEAQANNPPFSGGTTFTSLTVTTTDTICDRVAITNGDDSVDYTNLVGAGPVGPNGIGAEDPAACAQGGTIPEAPAAGLIGLAGLGVAGAAAFVWRRRNVATAT